MPDPLAASARACGPAMLPALAVAGLSVAAGVPVLVAALFGALAHGWAWTALAALALPDVPPHARLDVGPGRNAR